MIHRAGDNHPGRIGGVLLRGRADAPQGWVREIAGEHAQADAHYAKAVAAAEARGLHLLTLRAACSRARMWQGQGRHAQALALLQPVYDGFTEGFDFLDLSEARLLLDSCLGGLRDPTSPRNFGL